MRREPPGPVSTRSPLRRRLSASVVLVVALTLAGCGAQTVDVAAGRVSSFQQSVLEITQAVAAGQLDAAESALSTFRDELEEAVDRGDVSAVRYRQIDDALDEVSTELVDAHEARLAAAEAAEQAAAEQAAAEQAAAEEAAAEQAAAEQAAAAQAAAEQAAAAQAAAEQAAAEQAAAEQAAAEQPAATGGAGSGGKSGPAPEDKPGKGNGRDKGNG